MKYNKLIFMLPLAFVVSCFSDKGNYEYADKNVITIENIADDIAIMGEIENIKINPIIKSSLEGEIKEGNPYYQILYHINKDVKSPNGDLLSNYTDLNPNNRFNLDTTAHLAAKTYRLWVRVRDNRTGVDVAFKTVNLKIVSIIYEGWMVLCNEGAANRSRMDIISVISKERKEVAHDIMSLRGLPETNNSICIGFHPDMGRAGDFIYLINSTNAFYLHPESFETKAEQTLDKMAYIMPGKHRPVVFQNSPHHNMFVSQDGDAYVQVLEDAGPTFMDAVNKEKMSGPVTFKVAPFIGVSEARRANNKCAVFYDATNKRFMKWESSYQDGFCMSAMTNPTTNQLFDYTTGKEMIYMKGTRFSNSTIFAVMKDSKGMFLRGIKQNVSLLNDI